MEKLIIKRESSILLFNDVFLLAASCMIVFSVTQNCMIKIIEVIKNLFRAKLNHRLEMRQLSMTHVILSKCPIKMKTCGL